MVTPPIRFPARVAACALTVTALAGLGGVAYALTAPHSPSRHGAAWHEVLAPSDASIALSVGASHHSVVAGGDSRYRVHIVRACQPIQLCGQRYRRQAARVWLQVVGPLPPGLTATFGRRATRLLAAGLTVHTGATSRPGTYRLLLGASLRRHRGAGDHLARARITVTLTVTAAPRGAVTITGSPARPLLPGVVVPLDLVLTNARGPGRVVTGVSVTIQRLSAPRADAAHPCTTADFTISQFSGSYGFALPPSSTRSLAELGIAPDRWPALSMRDRPVDQDGCQGATISLAYGATVKGASK